MTKKADMVDKEYDGALFDFTVGPEAMDTQTREAYYRLRYVALNRSDETLLPEGRVMTLAEVETALGVELGEPLTPKPCC